LSWLLLPWLLLPRLLPLLLLLSGRALLLTILPGLALLKLRNEFPVTVLLLGVVNHDTGPLGCGSNSHYSRKRSRLLLRLSGLSACRGNCSRVRRALAVRSCSPANPRTTGTESCSTCTDSGSAGAKPVSAGCANAGTGTG